MTFLALIFKNIWRHRIRTLLTIVGISIGIATIVVFSLVSTGLYDAIEGITSPGKTDFTVARAGAADIIVSFLDEEQVKKIEDTEGVEEVAPYVLTIVSYGGNPYFLVGGVEAEKLDLIGVQITDGTTYSNDGEVIIGKIVAKNKKFKVGDEIELNKQIFKIVGVFESGIAYQDGGALSSIEDSQKLQGISDNVTMVSVKVFKDYSAKEVAESVERADKELVAIVDVEDYDAVDQGRVLINNISLAISLLAVVIGAIGVMNTIIMSVFERTREIGVLRAVGWKRRRVVFMILGESFLIGIFAAILGMLIGVGVIWGLANTEIGQAWLTIKYEPIIFIRALAVAIGVVLFGSIYPAYRAAKLLPTEALKYE